MRLREQPRLGRLVPRLERGDGIAFLQGQTDVVQAVQQAVLVFFFKQKTAYEVDT